MVVTASVGRVAAQTGDGAAPASPSRADLIRALSQLPADERIRVMEEAARLAGDPPPVALRPADPAQATSAARTNPWGDLPSAYAPPSPPTEGSGINEGGVQLDFAVRYLTDHVYRGVDFSETGGSEDQPNLQFDGRIEFDLGRFPHPFVEVFSNVYDADPASEFQEVRPTVGLDWTVRPLTIEAGHTTYLFPDRDQAETGEVYTRITLDDSLLWRTERPVISPYVLAAYDYDLNDGWYFETGLRHDMLIEDWNLTLSFVAAIAYFQNLKQVFVVTSPEDTGFHHYDLGLIGSYSLNRLLNIAPRYGDFALEGYLFYTGGVTDKVMIDDQLYGGIGIRFRY